MPEGDTIHRAAATLRRALTGKSITRFSAPRLHGDLPLAGDTVDDVEARGKHLLVHFRGDGRDLSLRTHLRMRGSWHVYRPGDRWQRSRSAARVVIEVEDAVAVCFSAPVVEVLATPRMQRHPELLRLGPDLSCPRPDLETALARLATHAPQDTEIADVLLDQRIACGVGNVYKSETLFACGVSPFTRVQDIATEVRRALLETASRLLQANLDGYPHRTVPGGLAVYGRAGKPCRRCGTPVAGARQGAQARPTYWCPTCQPGRGAAGRTGGGG